MLGIGTGRRAKIRAAAATALGVALLSGLMLGRTVGAADPQDNATRPMTSAQVRQATAPLATLEEAFMAIAQRMEPSVVSIRVNKTIKTAANFQDPGELFGGRGFSFQFPFGQAPRDFKVNGAGSGVIVRS